MWLVQLDTPAETLQFIGSWEHADLRSLTNANVNQVNLACPYYEDEGVFQLVLFYVLTKPFKRTQTALLFFP